MGRVDIGLRTQPRTQMGTHHKKRLCVWKLNTPPAGFEQLLQHTGLTHIRKQGGTESGTVDEVSNLMQEIQALISLIDSQRELLAELLKKMG